MAFIKSWSASGGNYCDLHSDYFVIGRNNGPWDDNSGQCTNEEFLAGMFQNDVAVMYGEDVLNEIIGLIKGIGENPLAIEERTNAYKTAELWKQIPENTYLQVIYEDYDERGSSYYSLEEGYFIRLPEQGLEINDEGTAWLSKAEKVIMMSFSCNAAICMDGNFYLAGGELTIMDSHGNLLQDSFSSMKEFKRDEKIHLPFEYMKALELGDRFRITDLYRRGKDIVCLYENYFYTNTADVLKAAAGERGLLEITPLGIKNRLILK